MKLLWLMTIVGAIETIATGVSKYWPNLVYAPKTTVQTTVGVSSGY